MYYLSKLCCFCLNSERNLQIINTKMYIKALFCAEKINEIDEFIPKYTCAICVNKLNFIFEFEHMCLNSIRKYNGADCSLNSTPNDTLNNAEELSQFEFIPCSIKAEPVDVQYDSGTFQQEYVDCAITEHSKIKHEKSCNENVEDEQIRTNPPDSVSSGMRVCYLCLKTNESTRNINVSKMLFCMEQAKQCGALLGEKFMCNDCSNKLNIAFHFKKQCSNSVKHFKSYINILHSSATNIYEEFKDIQVLLIDLRLYGIKVEPSEVSDEKYSNRYLIENVNVKVEQEFHSELILDNGDVNSSTSDTQNVINNAKSKSAKNKNLNNRVHCCSTCGKYFRNSHVLKTHVLIHTNERPYKCELCGKGFTDKKFLSSHVKVVHTTEGQHCCPTCGKCFIYNYLLKRHILLHTDERPYKCDSCEKEYNCKRNLKAHMQVHMSESIHSCSICGKSFNQKKTLKSHELTHTNERPFLCTICGKCFTVRKLLKAHEKIHKDERPFPCPTCEKNFKQSYELKVHMRTHTNERNYCCSICNKRYKVKTSLKEHVMKKHLQSQTKKAKALSEVGEIAEEHLSKSSNECVFMEIEPLLLKEEILDECHLESYNKSESVNKELK